MARRAHIRQFWRCLLVWALSGHPIVSVPGPVLHLDDLPGCFAGRSGELPGCTSAFSLAGDEFLDFFDACGCGGEIRGDAAAAHDDQAVGDLECVGNGVGDEDA